MKQPIEPSEIRKGDLIRVEWAGIETAEEWRTDGSPLPYNSSNVNYFLIEERPKPAVELPEVPTLGWISFHGPNGGYSYPALETVCLGTDRYEGKVWRKYQGANADPTDVRSWTPATAVPTAALDELREWHSTAPEPTWGRIATFLAAVDEAQS